MEGGGTIFRFYEGGDIELMGDPSSPPLEKTLPCRIYGRYDYAKR